MQPFFSKASRRAKKVEAVAVEGCGVSIPSWSVLWKLFACASVRRFLGVVSCCLCVFFDLDCPKVVWG